MEDDVREKAEELCQKDVIEVQDGGEAFERCVDDPARNAMQDIYTEQQLNKMQSTATS